MSVLKSNARNFIINGAMDYWQRGVTFTSGSNEYTADRWTTLNGPGSGNTLTERSDVVPNNDFNYSMKISANNHSLDYFGFRQVIESRFISELEERKGKCVISFWLKSSKTGSMNILIRTNQGAVTGYLAKIDILNTDYNRYIIEVPKTEFPLTIGKNNNNGVELFFMLKPFLSNPAPLGWSLSPDGSTTDGTTNFNFSGTDEVLLTGVMINTNSPQDFQRAGGNEFEELRLCQRYYQTDQIRVEGFSGTAGFQRFQYPVAMNTEMRVEPVVSSVIQDAGGIRSPLATYAYIAPMVNAGGNSKRMLYSSIESDSGAAQFFARMAYTANAEF